MIKIPPESYIGHIENRYQVDIEIGKYTSIAKNLRIIVASHPSITNKTVSNFPFRERLHIRYPKCIIGGKIEIGNDVWIGENVNIVGEVKIGDGAIVGAFSTVAKDVEPYSIVVGNPIRVIRYIFSVNQIQSLLKIKWWNWSTDKIKENIDDFLDINKFLQKYE